MGLDDLAMMRAIHHSTVVYPADAVATEKLMFELIHQEGIAYLRAARPKTPMIYSSKESFPIGGSKLHKAKKKNIRATVVAAGVTLHEALAAQKELAKHDIHIHVLDCYSVKPIDIKMLHQVTHDSKHLIVVEDHYPEGGLGEAVMSAFAINDDVHLHHLAVYKLPRSGKPDELLDYMGISAKTIVSTVKRIK